MHIAYVNLFVTDLDRAVAFYRDHLGLDHQMTDAEHGYASFQAGPVRLGLARVEGEHAHLAGRHTGVGFDVEDLEAEHARLAKLGVRFPQPPRREPWGGFMALVEDPDGNVLYLDQISAARHE